MSNLYVKTNGLWWKYDQTTPKSSARLFGIKKGLIKENINISSKEIISANNFLELNWHNTCVYDNRYKTGWLDPNGIFFGCDYRFHEEQAKLIHNKTDIQLENLGYIKISYENYNTIRNTKVLFASNNTSLCPTAKQIEYIKNFYNEPNKEDVLSELKLLRFEQLNKS